MRKRFLSQRDSTKIKMVVFLKKSVHIILQSLPRLVLNEFLVARMQGRFIYTARVELSLRDRDRLTGEFTRIPIKVPRGSCRRGAPSFLPAERPRPHRRRLQFSTRLRPAN